MKTLAAPQDKREIRLRLESLTTAHSRQWGTMTLHGMICHLADAFRLPLGEKSASPSRPPLPRALYKWAALRLPMKWPKGVPTRPEMEQGLGGTIPADFDTDRKELLVLIERFTTSLQEEIPPHPIFGPMTSHEWLRWGYLHVDHHLRQFGA
jgi:Protein of unknown function (DUF1569)